MIGTNLAQFVRYATRLNILSVCDKTCGTGKHLCCKKDLVNRNEMMSHMYWSNILTEGRRRKPVRDDLLNKTHNPFRTSASGSSCVPISFSNL